MLPKLKVVAPSTFSRTYENYNKLQSKDYKSYDDFQKERYLLQIKFSSYKEQDQYFDQVLKHIDSNQFNLAQYLRINFKGNYWYLPEDQSEFIPQYTGGVCVGASVLYIYKLYENNASFHQKFIVKTQTDHNLQLFANAETYQGLYQKKGMDTLYNYVNQQKKDLNIELHEKQVDSLQISSEKTESLESILQAALQKYETIRIGIKSIKGLPGHSLVITSQYNSIYDPTFGEISFNSSEKLIKFFIDLIFKIYVRDLFKMNLPWCLQNIIINAIYSTKNNKLNYLSQEEADHFVSTSESISKIENSFRATPKRKKTFKGIKGKK
ncbi:hypothetical protein EDC55_11730 [Allofrancisella inopinata]|uniref:Uncharacterized protein n=1 Tax=Allofrancisella inopinata TaxID=1085647 RepID=A0AAE7CQ30_9GAMM|nr:hypothetical protein [Allofrancisella inopinata]QIV95430.1 hypothetical protein E4K63_00685 [Allofrancisella inopinata]TDT69273.1 hypothetical protein EDC55_11730 [Allofrancisella inopinata]